MVLIITHFANNIIADNPTKNNTTVKVLIKNNEVIFQIQSENLTNKKIYPISTIISAINSPIGININEYAVSVSPARTDNSINSHGGRQNNGSPQTLTS